MTFILSRVNADTNILVVRWHINFVLRYLHTSAQTFMAGMAIRMVQHGYYSTILPAHEG